MEPQSNQEKAPVNNPENLPKTPEIAQQSKKLDHLPIGTLEQLGDNAPETQQAADNSLQATADDVTTLATIPTPAADGSASATTINDGVVPTIAADDDVIEKEWVDKAKKVINQTKGDPHAKEREVSKLQADYMQKRYGKQVKIPDET